MDKKTILVTGIGGNVGQGIIRNIRCDFNNIRIVGTNISQNSAGNHLTDAFYKVPLGYEPNYLAELIKIVEQENVDLIIPSTDYEVAVLARNKSVVPAQVACSDSLSAETYLDKYLSYQLHKKYNIPFSESCLPSEFKHQFSPAIAKPRRGRGSKGLILNYTGERPVSDEEYIIQEMHSGKEITTAVYVSYITGKLVGLITMERTLKNGATVYCKVIKEYDSQLEKIALDIIKNTGVRGAFNIQSIVTSDSKIYPFEINCRISGTNSIRSHFGFKDVKYTVDELLFSIIPPQEIHVSEGEAFRYLSDVIYPNGIKSGTNSDTFTLF